MSLLNLSFIVILGILIFVSYFHFSNSFLDSYYRKSNGRFKFENSIRVVIFILPAIIVLFIFIWFSYFYKLIVKNKNTLDFYIYRNCFS